MLPDGSRGCRQTIRCIQRICSLLEPPGRHRKRHSLDCTNILPLRDEQRPVAWNRKRLDCDTNHRSNGATEPAGALRIRIKCARTVSGCGMRKAIGLRSNDCCAGARACARKPRRCHASGWRSHLDATEIDVCVRRQHLTLSSHLPFEGLKPCRPSLMPCKQIRR